MSAWGGGRPTSAPPSAASAASSTDRYPVHRQRFPASRSDSASRLGGSAPRDCSYSHHRDITMPGVQ